MKTFGALGGNRILQGVGHGKCRSVASSPLSTHMESVMLLLRVCKLPHD